MNRRNKKLSKITEKPHAVFYIKPVSYSSSGIIKCAGHVYEGNKINDEPLKCTHKNKCLKDGNINEYTHNISRELFVRFYRSVFTDTHLLNNKTLPVIYCSVFHSNKVIVELLMNIFIEFTIEEDIKSEKQLINNSIRGKYKITIMTQSKTESKGDDKTKTLEIDEYLSNTKMIDTLKILVETDDMMNIIKDIIEEKRQEKIDKYGGFDNAEITKPTYDFKKLVKEYTETGKISL